MSRFTVVSSDRPAALVEHLADALAREPLSPFEQETIVVQSMGMERWVANEIATRHGCAASLRFPFPAAFCNDLARAIGGDAEVDPRFDRDALTWRILELVECGAAAGEEFSALRGFTAGADMRGRLGLATHVAARFDDYQLYRPEILLAWERGELVPDDRPHVRWQAALWRLLCDGESPARHLGRWFLSTVERLERGDVALPPGFARRITVFGVSTLPPLFLRLLAAASKLVPVTLYVVAPPRRSWPEAAAERPFASFRAGSAPAAEGGHHTGCNPLYSAFGASTGTLLHQLLKLGASFDELHEDEATPPRTVLATLQHDLAHGIARGPEQGMARPLALPPDDTSLALHVCHSPLREMEVLRDQLLDAFAADPTLAPHDVLVMVPDVGRYAPFVEAVFGVGEPGLPRIPHRVADRPIAQESSLAETLLRILRLAGARWTAAEVLALLDLPAVARAAGIPPGATERLLGWVEETRIRWGRDGAMRRDCFGLPAIEENTWRAGLDRLIMGYAVGPEEALVAGVLPSAGHTIGDPETLGAFARWTDRLFATLDDWRRSRSLAGWAETLGRALEELVSPDDEDDDRAMRWLRDALAALRTTGEQSGCARDVDIAVVRDWLERKLGDDSFGTGFLAGGMTVCAMKPMRAIPFRVIAVAGLDDEVFPRSPRRPGFDLMELFPREGDRDIRADDRQLFLDTILSASERLILSHVGRSARDNRENAVSVVVAELLDIVDRTFTVPPEGGEARRARDHLTVAHRLQPFGSEYYSGESPKLFSYSRVYAGASAAAAAERAAALPFVAQPLEPADGRHLDIALGDLIDCWINPAKLWCRRVLQLRLPGEDAQVEDCEPMAVDSLLRYSIEDEILRAHLAGRRDRERERAHAVARGRLPAGRLGALWYDRIDEELADFLSGIVPPRYAEPQLVEIRGEGWTLRGRVDHLTDEGRLHVRPASCKSKDWARAWITHLAMSAEHGDFGRTLVVGTDGAGMLGYVPEPLPLLDALVRGYRETLSSPIPAFERASWEYVRRVEKPGPRERTDPLEAARGCWKARDFDTAPKGDSENEYVALCWRGRDPLGGDAAEFVRWSRVLWAPMFAHQKAIAEAEAGR